LFPTRGLSCEEHHANKSVELSCDFCDFAALSASFFLVALNEGNSSSFDFVTVFLFLEQALEFHQEYPRK